MRLMDRYLLRNFIGSWAICFISIVGLYVIIDLFSNADEFLEDRASTPVFARRVLMYYSLHSLEYFARLAPIITMVAAMTTLATLHRHNELAALLAAGVPTKRALTPVLVGAGLVTALGVANREVFLPANSDVLQRMHEDIEAIRALTPTMHIDRDKVLIKADFAYREDQRLERVNITLPIEVSGQIHEIQAASAFFEREETTGSTGWRLTQTAGVGNLRDNAKIFPLPTGDWFMVSNVTFKDMIRRHTWALFASVQELREYLQSDVCKNPQPIRVMIHGRLMQPVLNFLLVLLGAPFVLQWEQRNVLRSVAVSMLLVGILMGVVSVMEYLANYEFLDPLLAAWTPVFIFGPVATALSHRIGT